MKLQRKQIINLFLGMVVAFVGLISVIFIPILRNFTYMSILSIIVLLLGGIILFKRNRIIDKNLRRFITLTTVSAICLPICAVLHNIVYGLFINIFGPDIWSVFGNEEPFLFIIATIISPILFIVGSIGTIYLLIKEK